MPSDPLDLRRSRPALTLSDEVAFARARVHELTGPARRSLAVMLAAAMAGPVLWIAPKWETDRPNPDGLRPWLDPARLLFATCIRAEDLLWTVEEALRSGAAPTVIADLIEPPGLTPVRRLLLAAEQSGTAPLGLILTPGEGGAPGVESRWFAAQSHTSDRTAWTVERRRARHDPVRAWLARRRDGRLDFGPPDRAQPKSEDTAAPVRL